MVWLLKSISATPVMHFYHLNMMTRRSNLVELGIFMVEGYRHTRIDVIGAL